MLDFASWQTCVFGVPTMLSYNFCHTYARAVAARTLQSSLLTMRIFQKRLIGRLLLSFWVFYGKLLSLGGLATVPTPPPTVEPQTQVQGKRQHWAVLSRSGPWNHDFIGISLRALTYLLCRLHCHSTVCSGGWHVLQN